MNYAASNQPKPKAQPMHSISNYPALTEDTIQLSRARYEKLIAAEKLLHNISTCSPASFADRTGNHRNCSLCLTFIDDARDIFGYEHYPEIHSTPKKV